MNKKLFLFLSITAIISHGTQAQIINTIAGDGSSYYMGIYGYPGPATAVGISGPSGVAVDSNGNVYLVDQGNNVIDKVTIATGMISTTAGTIGGYSFTGDGGQATAADIGFSTGITLDRSGNVYIAGGNNVIRKVTVATGIITTIAGNGYGLANGGYSGDGGQATAAELKNPTGVAVDSSGNVYIADYGNSVIRKVIAATGIITTVVGNTTAGYSGDGGQATVAELDGATGVTLDGSGNIYIADQGNNVIRKVTASTGIITTIAGNGSGSSGYTGDGGLATTAELNNPDGVAVDNSGNMYIADQGNNVIRKITASTGVITTIAGNGMQGYSGDGAQATAAELKRPAAVALDNNGNVYIADEGNDVIRKVTIPTTGTATVSSGMGLHISLFPNPAISSAMLTYTGTDDDVTVRITDIISRVIYTTTASGQAGSIVLPIQSLSPGDYMVTLQTGDRHITEKLIKE